MTDGTAKDKKMENKMEKWNFMIDKKENATIIA